MNVEVTNTNKCECNPCVGTACACGCQAPSACGSAACQCGCQQGNRCSCEPG